MGGKGKRLDHRPVGLANPRRVSVHETGMSPPGGGAEKTEGEGTLDCPLPLYLRPRTVAPPLPVQIESEREVQAGGGAQRVLLVPGGEAQGLTIGFVDR